MTTDQQQHSHWLTHAFYAMGSQMSIWVELADESLAKGILRHAEAYIRAAEQVFSRFDPTSQLSALNARPEQWVPVSPLLWQATTTALSLAQETGGLFDPTMLAALEAAGYTCSFELLHKDPLLEYGNPAAPVALGRWQSVKLDTDRRAIWLPAGLRLDLGGIAKGFTAQKIARFLSGWGPSLVDAGGDLTAGSPPAGYPGWPVSIAAPLSPGKLGRQLDFFTLWLAEATLATSGQDRRRWRNGNLSAHHIIDPRTGEPAVTDLLTVSVIAQSAARAEAWATATLVAGLQAGRDLLSQNRLAGLLVRSEFDFVLTPHMQTHGLWLAESEMIF
jgi:thiamine biosynthesis lipoprotein